MTRRVVHRVIVIALVSWVCGHVAVGGGCSIAADVLATELLPAPGQPDGSLGLAWHSSTELSPHGGADTPFASLDSATVVGWVNAMLSSQTAVANGAAWIVPPTALIPGGSAPADDDPSFENERREAVYLEIAESPGRYIAALATSIGISESTVRYHVRVLEDQGLVRSAVIRGKRHYYLPDLDRWVVGLEAALTDDSRASILDAIARLEPATVTTLAEEVDLAPSTTSYHLKRFAANDLVERERTGQTVVIRLDPEVRAYLAETDMFGVGDADGISE